MSKLTVAGVELRSKYILAPLAGYTSYAMRKISNEYGVGMTYTEMISSSALVYDSKKTMSMLPKKKEETPVALQLFGGDKEKYICPYCGAEIDRDINAAINIRNKGQLSIS